MWNIKALAVTAEKLLARLKFSKNGSNSKVKVTGSKKKGFITRNTHVKYQRSSSHCSKVISKVKVFKKWIKLQGQGHRVKNNGNHRKVLSQGILMWNIKALALTVQKLLARLKFQRGQNYRMTDRTKTICPPIFDLGGIKTF